MSRIKNRLTRIFKKTHTFVPKQKLEAIAEYELRKLEAIPRTDDLERRVAAFAELLERVKTIRDPAAQAEFARLWWEEEARLTYYIRLREGLPEIPGSGIWFENSMAGNALQRARDAKSGLERIEREQEKRDQQENL